MEKKMQKLTKEQDKAYKIFTDFLMKVINITDTLHTTPKQIPEHTMIKDKALKELSEILFKNYNWHNALNKTDIESLYKIKTKH